jgi:hypothetical protein
LSFSMILSRAEFSSFVCSTSFAIILVRYTRIPRALGDKFERTKNKQEAKVV